VAFSNSGSGRFGGILKVSSATGSGRRLNGTLAASTATARSVLSRLNQAEMDDYLRRREAEGEELRPTILETRSSTCR
jgi:hypothetical protein